MKFNGWVLLNLQKYGNSLLPDDLMETLNNDIQVAERLIEYAYEKPVQVVKTSAGYVVKERAENVVVL